MSLTCPVVVVTGLLTVIVAFSGKQEILNEHKNWDSSTNLEGGKFGKQQKWGLDANPDLRLWTPPPLFKKNPTP